MKKFLIIPFLFLAFSLSAIPDTLWVATTGSNSYAGDSLHPYATFQKAIDMAEAGDTVIFRGGTYYETTQIHYTPVATPHIGHNGTIANPIVYMAYPGEKPIFDWSLYSEVGSFNAAMSLVNVHYIKFKGLEIRNVWQTSGGVRTSGVMASGINCMYCTHLTWDQMSVHNIAGRSYVSTSAFDGNISIGITTDSTYFTNCDFYDLCDSLCVSPDPEVCATSAIGGISDGIKLDHYEGFSTFIEGCRFWHWGDNAIDISGQNTVTIKNNWVFRGGDFPDPTGFDDGAYAGEGSGIKFGTTPVEGDSLTSIRTVINNLVAFCHSMGFDESNSWEILFPCNAVVYNNTSYKNQIFVGDFSWETGGRTMNNKYKNNISYKEHAQLAIDTPPYNMDQPCLVRSDETDCGFIEAYNSWTTGNFGRPTTERIALTDADFVTADSTTGIAQLTAARNADGSLPTITFMKLAETSDAIDAGIVDYYYTLNSMAYNDAAPDLGYSEYGLSATDSTGKYILSYTFTEATGVAVIDTAAKTVDIEVEYGTDVTGLIATFTLSEGATAAVGATPQVSGTTANDFTSPVTYVVTDLNTNTVNWTVTVTVEDNPVPTVATVGTTSADYTAITANVTGRIYSANGGTLTERGVCWSTSNTSPTVSDKRTLYTPYVGSYTDVIRGLRANTTYYFRAYATTSEGGTSYGDAISFTTRESSVPTQSGKVLIHNGQIILAK